ncbi:SOS response-associated peptidase [Flavobacterium sp. SM2513]|uniref:SOS response-associated peptidase n=1 Tax=Flavobacterium sp. SM2513 TaxID=3424766 RepID=UPI003D7F8C9F
MCFHTIQSKLAKQIERRFNAKIREPHLFQPQTHINGFDFPKTPIITNENPDIIEHYNWGLIPTWAKEDKIKAMTLNAKIETLEEKPSFRDAISNRCLVIANGFYEWQWQDSKGKNKIKYEIGINDQNLFTFAGLFSKWTDINTGEIRNTYTIVTTEANPLMAEIHNIKKRMPIILRAEDELKWLSNTPIEQYAFPYSVSLTAKKESPPAGFQNSLF